MSAERPPPASNSGPAPSTEASVSSPSPPPTAPPATKIDPVTQVQDAIDGLALSLFEALRGIRDATAPEALVGGGEAAPSSSGSAATPGTGTGTSSTGSTTHGTGSGQGGPSDEPDYDDFLIAHHNRQPHALEVVQRAGGRPPQSKEEYLKVLARMDFESDVGTAQRLATEIVDKSREVDELVEHLPGMGRTKEEQMAEIAKLIQENVAVDRQLVETHRVATERRDQVRAMLGEVTCKALGIEEG